MLYRVIYWYPFRLCLDQRIQVSVKLVIENQFIVIHFFTRTYKTWYYGLYINTERNIIVDSVATADSAVDVFLFRKSISRK